LEIIIATPVPTILKTEYGKILNAIPFSEYKSKQCPAQKATPSVLDEQKSYVFRLG
jgi:aspartokinase-like uncharacterized kinase